ncbi:MAG: alpha-agarase, partial [Bacteroidota bacterium]
AIASVSNTGVVNGLTTGTTTVTYTNSNGCTDTEIITVVAGTKQPPTLTLPATNTSGATTLNFNYTLPETPLAGSVTLTFIPTNGGTPVVWTMNNATSATFSYVVGTNPATISNIASGAALGFTIYNVTLAYQDAFANSASNTTNTNIQTLAPPSISFASASQNKVVNSTISIATINTGGAATFTILPSLPTGLTINAGTGLISGTTAVAMASRQYTVTATNAAGTNTASFNLLIDTDLDGDGEGDSTDSDIDGDGVPNTVEIQQGTDPTTPGDAVDTDGDGVPDYIEVQQGTDPTTPGDAVDTDGDGVPDYIEVQQGTNPTTPGDAVDTDGDGVPDYVEVQQGTDPTTPGDAVDTDGDGVPDYIEVQQGTNPTTPGDAVDTDGDGVPDYIEVQQGTDPTTPGDAVDTDGDGVPDYIEVQQGTNPTTPGDAVDTDGDGVPDYIEVQQGTNPTTPGDAVDTDGDGVPDYIEVQQGTDPTTPGDAVDTDGDGVPDYIEVQQGTNPTTPGDAVDTDGDGVPDYIEVQQGTNPAVPGARDTDGDGLPDYYEDNNFAPTDISLSANSINENNAINAVVGQLSSTDLGDIFEHTYTLVSGTGSTDNASFSIVGNEIKAGIAFDFETKSSYSIRVKTTDAGGLSYEKVFAITVVDVVENVAPTNIALSTTSIAENNAANAVVGTLSSTDADAGDTHTYTLVSGVGSTDNASFSIVGNEIKAGIAFDFETKSSYSIRVKTTDVGGLSFEKAFTITVTNVNETPILSVSQTTNLGVVGIPLTTITVTNSSGPATSFAITPALSAGLTFNTTTGSISGTPTLAMASRTYTISGTNSDGTGTVSLTLFIDQDTDRDGLLDSIDTDDDGDLVLDNNDAFPLNKNEWKDTDRDGTGDNADTDDDNDGILDACDVDSNGDGIPDNGTDLDADGINDGCDTDKDGDGVNNTSDNCPNSPNTDQADRDNDGLGDSCDTIEINVSQAITPNGDGINDTWVVYNLGNHPGSTVRVFNANGTQVFYSANYQNNWTGNYEGKNEMLPVGSYLYQIDLGGDGSIDAQGWLYITK